MKKDEYCMFNLNDYTEEQMDTIIALLECYPMHKWLQLLSPYHSMLIYDGIADIDKETDPFQLYNHLINLYGKITVKLDYALTTYLRKVTSRRTYEEAYVYLKEQLDKDGDELADAILVELNEMLPTRYYVNHNRELDAGNFIVREPIDEAGLDWCLGYTGYNHDNCNIVCMWNNNKKAYYKQLQDSVEEDD